MMLFNKSHSAKTLAPILVTESGMMILSLDSLAQGGWTTIPKKQIPQMVVKNGKHIHVHINIQIKNTK